MSALSEVQRFVSETCARLRVAREPGLKVSLLVEELFTNTVRHGYGRDTDETIVLAIETAPGRVTVTYEDRAPAHDPFTARSASPESPPPTDAKEGGVGLRLIAGMSTPEYRYANGANRISLSIDTP